MAPTLTVAMANATARHLVMFQTFGLSELWTLSKEVAMTLRSLVSETRTSDQVGNCSSRMMMAKKK